MRLSEELIAAIDEAFVDAFDAEAAPGDLVDEGGRLRLEDAPMAEHLAPLIHARFRFAVGLGWVRYDGKRWAEVTDDRVSKEIQRRFIAMFKEEAPKVDAERRRRLSGLLGANRIRAVRSLLRGLLEQDGAEFDAQPHLLNCQNGVVDLRTGELGPHDPDLLFTKITPVPYIAGATHPDWDLALQALPDDDTREWLRVKLGQAATGRPAPDDVLPILFGGGHNGKSSIVCVRYALGEFASVVPDRLLVSRPSDHPTELTELKGVRMAILEELPEKTLSVSRLKSILGTPTVTARRIARNTMAWEATHTLVLTTNHKPRVSESDFGTWRRLALVTFPFRFRNGDKALELPNDRRGSEGLRERLEVGQEQWTAMLAWLVSGAVDCYQGEAQRVPEPSARVRSDTSAWRGESDLLLQFATSCLEFDPGSCVLATELHEAFTVFAESTGHMALASNTFSERLEAHELAAEHNLRKARSRVRGELSRRHGHRKAANPTGPASLWFGVRFREGV